MARFPGFPRIPGLPRGYGGAPRPRRRRPVLLTGGALLVAAVLALVGGLGQGQRPPAQAGQPGQSSQQAGAPALPAGQGVALLGGGSISDREEAEAIRETLALIRQGPPYPHRQDGVRFENREDRLPAKPLGHYREFTVRTQGERTRGARRIVRGADGELWYSPDHYRTFLRLAEQP